MGKFDRSSQVLWQKECAFFKLQMLTGSDKRTSFLPPFKQEAHFDREAKHPRQKNQLFWGRPLNSNEKALIINIGICAH
jgi:hypothetical protein